MLGIGTSEVLVIGAIVLVFFGAKRLPQLGTSVAKGIKNFQKGLKGEEDSPESEDNKQS